MEFTLKTYKAAMKRSIKRIQNLRHFDVYGPRLRKRQHELVLIDRRANRELA